MKVSNVVKAMGWVSSLENLLVNRGEHSGTKFSFPGIGNPRPFSENSGEKQKVLKYWKYQSDRLKIVLLEGLIKRTQALINYFLCYFTHYSNVYNNRRVGNNRTGWISMPILINPTG